MVKNQKARKKLGGGSEVARERRESGAKVGSRQISEFRSQNSDLCRYRSVSVSYLSRVLSRIDSNCLRYNLDITPIKPRPESLRTQKTTSDT